MSRGPSLASPTELTRATSIPRLEGATPPERRRIYFTRRSDLWQLPVDNAVAPVISGRVIVGYRAAPDGNRVAAIVAGDAGETVLVVNADSTVAFETALSNGPKRPAAGDSTDRQLLAWSPDGTRVAVALADGSIVVVDQEGKAHPLVPSHPGAHPTCIDWSPDGTMLSFLDPAGPGLPMNLNLVNVAGGAPRTLVDGSSTGGVVTLASWMPRTQAIIYIQTAPGSLLPGGDLFLVDTVTGKPDLLQPAGNFAPVAAIRNLALSTDGEAVAFTVFVPGTDRPRFDGLWILDLESRRVTQIDTDPDDVVTDLWWASGNLIYRTIAATRVSSSARFTGAEPFALYQIEPLQLAQQPVERFHVD
jgi:dipeptidyl aminopeptidase/acylaminoacyl peptidase